jgi:hypothetical protein
MEFNVMYHLMYLVSGTRLVVVIPPDKQHRKNQMPAIRKGYSTLTSWLLWSHRKKPLSQFDKSDPQRTHLEWEHGKTFLWASHLVLATLCQQPEEQSIEFSGRKKQNEASPPMMWLLTKKQLDENWILYCNKIISRMHITSLVSQFLVLITLMYHLWWLNTPDTSGHKFVLECLKVQHWGT